jgi:hypothetical protein
MLEGKLIEIHVQRERRPANFVTKADDARVCLVFQGDDGRGHVFDIEAGPYGVGINHEWHSHPSLEAARLRAGPPPDNPDDSPQDDDPVERLSADEFVARAMKEAGLRGLGLVEIEAALDRWAKRRIVEGSGGSKP